MIKLSEKFYVLLAIEIREQTPGAVQFLFLESQLGMLEAWYDPDTMKVEIWSESRTVEHDFNFKRLEPWIERIFTSGFFRD